MTFKAILKTLAASLGLSASMACAHGIWIVPRSGTDEKVWVNVSFADGPVAGAASMLGQTAQVQVFAIRGTDRQPVKLVRRSTGEFAALSGVTDFTQVSELEAVYLPPVRDGQPRTNSPSTGTASADPQTSGTGRNGPVSGGNRQEFYSKFALLGAGETLKSKANDLMKIDFLPEWDGQNLSIMVLQQGQPVEGGRVSISGPENFSDRAEAELGTVQFTGLKTGRYQAEVQLIDEAPSPEDSATLIRITRVGTLVLDLK